MIDALLTHLATACPDFAAIEDATRINPLERDDYPVVTVYLAGEAPALANLAAPYRVMRTYDLVVTCRGGDELEAARASLKPALRGFTAEGVLHVPEFVAGELINLSGGLLQWRDRWRVPVSA